MTRDQALKKIHALQDGHCYRWVESSHHNRLMSVVLLHTDYPEWTIESASWADAWDRLERLLKNYGRPVPK